VSPHLRATASRDALVLLLHVTGLTLAAYHANPDHPLTPAQQSAYEALILRRIAHEPIQYITGEQEFYGLNLRVTPAVLIPRPETEHLVEAVLAELSAHPVSSHSVSSREASRTAQSAILDVGTGSGAIAIALAHHLPYAQITATDISPVALEIAASNAERHHLTARIRFLKSDLLDELPSSRPEHGIAMRSGENSAFASDASGYDAIVSNPPYVPTTDREALHPQVRDFEPEVSLYGGPAGLDIYRRLIPQALAALKPNGLLALEIGHGQRDAIAELLTGWAAVRFVDDLQQIPRIALARKP
jgi:release factor glutamine methyltransferase